ncbi:MAG: hypothetical protein JNK21_05565 [Rhodospirillaceae bacterium]|nr:hypothetical protein [Rhodospirillaceae bacterium]
MTDSPFAATARELAPALAAAARTTHERGITREALAALNARGLLRMGHVPGEAWGLHLLPARILARSCATTAWIVTHCAEASRTIALMAKPARDAVWAKPETIAIAGDAAEPVSAERRGAEFVMSGHWPFVAAAGFADWFVLRGRTPEGLMAFAVPATGVTLTPTTHVGGLRGCGFQAVSADHISVPATHAVALPASDLTYQRAGILSAILGTAEGGYADYLAMTKKRVSGTGGGAVAKLTQVQIRLAEAEADVESARTLVDSITARLQGRETDDAVRLARDGAVAARRALQAVTQLVHQMGALGLAEFNPVQRHYRDIRAMATDARVNADTHLAAFGRQELGVPDTTAVTARAAE